MIDQFQTTVDLNHDESDTSDDEMEQVEEQRNEDWEPGNVDDSGDDKVPLIQESRNVIRYIIECVFFKAMVHIGD